MGTSCWQRAAGCWLDADCDAGYRCEGAFVCSCCEVCDCAGDAPGQCVVDPEPECSAASEPRHDGWGTCEDLAFLTVAEPLVEDESGDGVVSPGETALVTVVLSEGDGYGFSWYPGVVLETGIEGVSVVSDGDWSFALLPCSSASFSGTLRVADDIAPGTVVTITARAAMLNETCPDAPAVAIPLAISEP